METEERRCQAEFAGLSIGGTSITTFPVSSAVGGAGHLKWEGNSDSIVAGE